MLTVAKLDRANDDRAWVIETTKDNAGKTTEVKAYVVRGENAKKARESFPDYVPPVLDI